MVQAMAWVNIVFTWRDQCQGVCTLLSKHVTDFKLIYQDFDGQILIGEITLHGTTLTVCNIYAPNVDSPAFFQQVIEVVEQTDVCDRVIIGDFNLVLDVEVDRRGSAHNHTKADLLLQYMGNADMIDIWRLNHPQV